MHFTVLNPGVLTTIQDEGRFGFERFGISPAGPMDLTAFRVANILVGNEWSESALEATILGPTLLFERSAVIALTGADMAPQLDGKPCPMYQAVAVHAGSKLQLGAAKTGCRTYIAFSGGLDVPLVMNSRATALQNRVGGFEGRKLAKDDQLGIRHGASFLGDLHHRRAPVPEAPDHTIRAILGPQDDAFTPEGLEAFLTQPYTVGSDFDRMGYRLEGAKITHKTDGNIISDGIAAGAIQVPTSGQPIIMLAERQTVGGYTKIATVISADLPKIGQCKAGDVLHFRQVSVPEAHKLWRELDQELHALEQKIRQDAQVPADPEHPVTLGAVYDFTLTISDE